jgi:hypothetical protein
LFVFLLVVFATPVPARADFRPGIRGGVAFAEPTIFFLGGLLAIRPIPNLQNFRIDPSFELGLGTDNGATLFMVRLNGQFRYSFPITSSVALFPLFGLELFYANYSGARHGATNLGADLGGGVEVGPLEFSLYFGLGDVPNVDLVVAYIF